MRGRDGDGNVPRSRPYGPRGRRLGQDWTLQLGCRIRAWRVRRKLSQAEAASRAGIAQPTWSNYETAAREPTVAAILLVAAALDVTVGHLIDTDDLVFLADSRLARALDAAERMLP